MSALTRLYDAVSAAQGPRKAFRACARTAGFALRKRRARAMIEMPGQLDLISEGLSMMRASEMLARIEELRQAARVERRPADPLVGRTDLSNLAAAAIVARLWRRRLARTQRRAAA